MTHTRPVRYDPHRREGALMIGEDLIIDQGETCLHLYEKFPASNTYYPPTPDQRSTIELVRDLSPCALIVRPLKWMDRLSDAALPQRETAR